MQIIMQNPKCKYSKRKNYTKFDIFENFDFKYKKVLAKFSNPKFANLFICKEL